MKILLFVIGVIGLGTAQAFDLIRVTKCTKECPWSAHKFFHLTIANDTATLRIPPQTAFFVVQAHSQQHRLAISALSEDAKLLKRNNVGLVHFATNGTDSYDFRLITGNITGSVLIAVNAYKQTDPVPGGCAMEFPTEIAPYQNITYDEDIIVDSFQSASLMDGLCESLRDEINLEMYILTLPYLEFSNVTYYNSLQMMLSVDQIKTNGLPVKGGKKELQRLFTNYPGLGVVYGVVASTKNGSSSYVLALSYGCEINDGITGCISPKLLSYEMFLFGILVILSISLPFESCCPFSFAPGGLIFLVGIMALPYGFYLAFIWPFFMAVLAIFYFILHLMCFSMHYIIKTAFITTLSGFLLGSIVLFIYEDLFGTVENNSAYFVSFYSFMFLMGMAATRRSGFVHRLCFLSCACIVLGAILTYGTYLYAIIDHIRRIWLPNFQDAISNQNDRGIFANLVFVIGFVVIAIYECCTRSSYISL